MPERSTINVSLTPMLQRMVRSYVKSGRYQSSSEVVREALRLLHVRDLGLHDLDSKIDRGLRELDAERGIDGERFFSQRRRARAKRGRQ